MGANNKYEAAMHGYVPSELELITAWVDQRRNLLEYNGEPFEGVVERTSQAQRTIAKVRAEAKREALEEMANQLSAHVSGYVRSTGQLEAGRHIIQRIRARANQYKEAPSA